MKKIKFCLNLLFSITLSLMLSSCSYSKKEQQEIIEMFNSFEYTDKFAVQTFDKLRIGEKNIDVEDIKYNNQQCEIIILEENGFYAYAYNENQTKLNLLYITYVDMEIELVDEFPISSKIINTAYSNNALYFRTSDPTSEKYNQVYIIYDLITKEITNVDTDDVDIDESTIDNNRSTKYKFIYKDSAFGSDSVAVINKETGVKKKITKALVKTFEEGKLIEKKRKNNTFDISEVFVKNDDFYIISYFEIGFLGDPCYFYIWKWNFETEKAEYYTSIYFETYPEDVLDFYIFN